jgi:hypothetical protein
MNYTPYNHQLISHDDTLALEVENEIVRYQTHQELIALFDCFNLGDLLTQFAQSLPIVAVPHIEFTLILGEDLCQTRR